MDLSEAMRQVAEGLERVASVKAAFGEPYKQGDTTIIPVAEVRLRGGGGGGFGRPNEAKPAAESCCAGGGGGMGIRAESRPVGYIRVVGGLATFEPVTDSTALWKQAALWGGLALVVLLWRLTRRRAA